MSLKRRTSLRIGSIVSASAPTLRDPFERLGNSGSTHQAAWLSRTVIEI